MIKCSLSHDKHEAPRRWGHLVVRNNHGNYTFNTVNMINSGELGSNDPDVMRSANRQGEHPCHQQSSTLAE